MDNLSEQMGILSDEFIEECSEDSDDHGHSKNAPLREQDRFLPIANIAKIMKRAIPENGKVSMNVSIHPSFGGVLTVYLNNFVFVCFCLDCKRGA